MWSIKCKIHVTVLFRQPLSQIFTSETKIGFIIWKYKNLIKIIKILKDVPVTFNLTHCFKNYYRVIWQLEIVSFTYAGKTLFSRLYLFIFFWISAVSGDIRKALDVCQRALILAEIEDRNQTRLKLFDQKSEEKPAVALIGIPQIIKVVNEIYCSSVTTAMRNGNFLNFSCCFF